MFENGEVSDLSDENIWFQIGENESNTIGYRCVCGEGEGEFKP